MIKGKKLLVVSAHAADYVWRSGGTIAKYIDNGAEVHVVVLSYGVRGESNDLWKMDNQTPDGVKAIRKDETEKAARILGIKNIDFWDYEDYPIVFDEAAEERMIQKIREFRPDIILTHDKFDVLNFDHNHTSDFVWRCSIMSNSCGVLLKNTKPTKQMRLFGFEPHQTELSHYVPGSFVDITDQYEKKVAAMKCFQAQKHLIQYYMDRAAMRGNHARRLSGNPACQYAESFSNFAPVVGEELY